MARKFLVIVAVAVLVVFAAIFWQGLGLLFAVLYNLFALLIVGSFAALFGWYLFRILLPGVLRYRKLRQIRYYRAVNRRRRWDYEDEE